MNLPTQPTSDGETTLIRSGSTPNGSAISPLPPARELAQLECIQPGVTREILDRSRREEDHRRSLQTARLRASIASRTLAQGFTTISALAALFIARDFVFAGYSAFGLVLALTALAALAAVFIVIEGTRHRERQDERKALPGAGERAGKDLGGGRG